MGKQHARRLEIAAYALHLPPSPQRGPHPHRDLRYSGGTTGKPKALASTQRTALAAAQIMLAEWEWPRPPRVLSCAPLSHAGAAMVLPTLMKQGTILIQPAFDPLKVMQAIQEYRINCMLLVPSMIYALLDHPRFDDFDLSSLETVFYGASAIAPARLKEAIERIGPVFFRYGQAEAPLTICVMRKAELDVNDLRRLASCAVLCRGCALRCWTRTSARSRTENLASFASKARW